MLPVPLLPTKKKNQSGHSNALHLALPCLCGRTSCFSCWFSSQRNVCRFPAAGCSYNNYFITLCVYCSLWVMCIWVLLVFTSGNHRLNKDTWEEVRSLTWGRGGGDISHPLWERSGLTNAWVAGGVVYYRHCWSAGWLFLAGSSSSMLIPLFFHPVLSLSLFPRCVSFLKSQKLLFFFSNPTLTHFASLLEGELDGWRWEVQQ